MAKQVGIIWGENVLLSNGQVDATNAPFQAGLLTSSISGQSGRGYQFCNAISGVDHPSTPNYCAIAGGSNAPSPGADNNPDTTPSVVAAAGPTTTVNGNQTAPGSGNWTLTVASTTNFATSGTVFANQVLLAYSAKTATTFTVTAGGFGLTFSSGASVSQPNNIFDQCEAAGLTWKSYEEGNFNSAAGAQPAPNRHFAAGFYAKPNAKQWQSASLTPSGTPNIRADIGLTAGLTDDITKGNLPNFFMVTPSDLNSGHNTSLTFYDNWLQGISGTSGGVNTNYTGKFPGVAALLSAMDPEGVLILGVDGHNSNTIGPYYCLIMGTTPPAATPAVFTTAGTHYNVLYAVQQYLFGTDIDPRFSTTTPALASGSPAGATWSSKLGFAPANDNYKTIAANTAVPFPSAPATPTASLTPSSITFPNTAPGASSAVQQVTVSNAGAGTLTVATGGITLTGANPGKFTISALPSLPQNLTAGQSFVVGVKFTPALGDANGTSFSANLRVADNSGGVASSQTVPLSGTTTPSVQQASVTPPSLTFSVAAGSTSTPKTVTVSNTGGATLNINT